MANAEGVLTMSNTLGSVSGGKEWGNLGVELASFRGNWRDWAQARMLRPLVQTADRDESEIIHPLDYLDIVAYTVYRLSDPPKTSRTRKEDRVEQPLTAKERMGKRATEGLIVGIGVAILFCGIPFLGSNNGSTPTQTPTIGSGSIDCGPFLSAANHFADQLSMNQGALAAVDVTHVDSIAEMKPEIQCFVPGLVKAEIAWQGGSETFVSIVALGSEEGGAFRQLIGIIDSSQVDADGKTPMLLANAANDGLSVVRNGSGGIVIGVKEACSDCSRPVLELAAQDDSLQRFAIVVNGEVLGGLAEETTLSADQVGQLAGGGKMLGIANALLEKEEWFQGQEQLEGIGPDITNVAGVGGIVGGEVKASFSPDSAAIAAIADQGFMLVSQSREVCVRSDSTMVDKVTMKVFDREDPGRIYDLQLDGNGKPMVYEENGVYFVYYGEFVDGEFVPRQKEVIGMIGAFGDQLECAGIIVKNVNQVPEAVRAQLNLQIGDKLFALITKDGQVAAAVPAIVGIDDEVSLTVVADGHVQMTVVSDEGTRIFNLQVSGDFLKPPLPPLPEIVWDLSNPEAFPTKPFEYLTSTEFAQQVLDWEAAGKFPEVPDTAVPLHGIDVLSDSAKAMLTKYGFSATYYLTKQDHDSGVYQGSPEKFPYILAGVWKIEYQGESAFFILKKWKNWDNSPGFEGFIYKQKSTNPKAIWFELIDYGFGSKTYFSTGEYFSEGTTISKYGTSGCGAYFNNHGGNPNSAFCGWYFDNPNLVFNKEFYDRWEQTGILSNFITINGQKVPFIPISPIGGKAY